MKPKKHQILPKIDYSPTNYQKRNISSAKTTGCTEDDKRFNCKNHKSLKLDELQHANTHTRQSIEEDEVEQYKNAFFKYNLRKSRKTFSKREANETEDDPWDIISPIGKKKGK